jgi:hypothetical protein
MGCVVALLFWMVNARLEARVAGWRHGRVARFLANPDQG